MAHRHGRRVGVVTSVPFNHATPAALGGAHNVSRGNTCALALELLTSPTLDLIAAPDTPTSTTTVSASRIRRGESTTLSGTPGSGAP